MLKFLKKWLIRSTVSTLIFGGFISSAMTAYAVENVALTSTKASPETIDLSENEVMEISYCLNVTADIALGIFKETSAGAVKLVNLLVDDESKSAGCYKKYWDGENGTGSEMGTVGTVVADGTYFYSLSAESQYNSSTDYEADWIYVDAAGTNDGGDDTSGDSTGKITITDFELKNGIFSPWDGEEAQFVFSINRSAKVSLEITDEDGEEVITLVYKKDYSAGEHTIYWDGMDDFDDIVNEAEYTYKLVAEVDGEKDKENGKVEVQKDYSSSVDTEDPRFRNVYLTKETFDPGRGEKTYFVFTLTATADLTLEVYDNGGTKVETLVNTNNADAGTYKIAYDGNGLEDSEGTYLYKLYAENISGEELINGSFETEQDAKQDNKPNIYKDSTDISNLPFNPKNNSLDIEFKLETDSEVSIEIRDKSKILVELVEEDEMEAGTHTISWNGQDAYGDFVGDGIYIYKVIAENMKGKDTEYGNFSIAESTNANNPGADRCAGYSDVDESYKYCDAIKWATSSDVFQGYGDETFRAGNAINRAEALKVIMAYLNIRVQEYDYETTKFTDLDLNAWYMDYIKTALSLGIVRGYQDSTFRPNQSVSRAEALVMLLNTARVKGDLVISSDTYGQPYYDTPSDSWYIDYVWMAQEEDLTDNESYFYPASNMTRGEMADLLYRFNNAGLDD